MQASLLLYNDIVESASAIIGEKHATLHPTVGISIPLFMFPLDVRILCLERKQWKSHYKTNIGLRVAGSGPGTTRSDR